MNETPSLKTLSIPLLIVTIASIAAARGATPLASDPSGPPPAGRRGPPPEAFEACENKSEGEDCSVDIPGIGETILGTCSSFPGSEDEELHCRPNHPPPPKRKREN